MFMLWELSYVIILCVCVRQEFYKAASVHNPVENFASMSGTSDIPDWCYVQAGLKYDPLSPPTTEDYAELLSHSPMSAFNKVYTVHSANTLEKNIILLHCCLSHNFISIGHVRVAKGYICCLYTYIPFTCI